MKTRVYISILLATILLFCGCANQSDSSADISTFDEQVDEKQVDELNDNNEISSDLPDGPVIVRQDNSSGGWTVFEYDSDWRLVKEQHATYEVDYEYENDQLIRVTSTDGLVEEYDSWGNLTYQLWSDGTWKKYEYINGNYLISSEFSGGSFFHIIHEDGSPTGYYETPYGKYNANFNEEGLLISYEDADGKVLATREYDADGNLIKEYWSQTEWTEYEYDSYGRLLCKKTPIHWEKYEYDEFGNLIRYEDSSGCLDISVYDSRGNIVFCEDIFTPGNIDTVITYTNTYSDGVVLTYEGDLENASDLSSNDSEKSENSSMLSDSLCFTNEDGYVVFGSYEQDGNLSDGSEPIEWMILDENEDEITLISRYVLDYVQYNKEFKPVTWSGCFLRKWLNDDFYNSAFSEDEKNSLIQLEINDDSYDKYFEYNEGSDVADYVICLSLNELMDAVEFDELYTTGTKYGCSHELFAEPTVYAISKAIPTWTITMDSLNDLDYELSESYVGMTLSPWWLRTAGYTTTDGKNAACIVDKGWIGVNCSIYNNSFSGVRPVICIRK